jgi:hypothetical protein
LARYLPLLCCLSANRALDAIKLTIRARSSVGSQIMLGGNSRVKVVMSIRGTPLNGPNVRNRIWMPLLARSKIPYRDMYSLRWTFVSLAQASGEEPFNVSRVIGQTRSVIVDTIYAHTVKSGVAGVSESVQRECCPARRVAAHSPVQATSSPIAQSANPAARDRRRTGPRAAHSAGR